MKTEIYLDSNAATSVLATGRVAALRAFDDDYGNPSSSHSAGLRARAIVEDARATACRLLGVGEGRLVFNSGATEGIQTAILSALCAVRERRNQGLPTGSVILYGATEHKAVPESLAHWNRLLGLDLELRELTVDRAGRHDLEQLRGHVDAAALVCTMAANNETGALSDLDGIAAVMEGSRALWLVDCVQALGKMELNLSGTRIDYAPISGHKLYAPKGVGMLYVRAGAPYTPLMAGGGQENGLRAGTENVAGIAALGAVLASLEQGTQFKSPKTLETMRDRLVAALTESFPDIVFNTPLGNSLPTTLNVAVPTLLSGQLLDVLDAAGVRVSAGSACSASSAKPSYVLEAMGLLAWQASHAVRISFGPIIDAETIDEACRRIRRCSKVLRDCGVLDAVAVAGNDMQPAGLDAPAVSMHLDVAALRRLLLTQPDTKVIDVRESFEHLASPRQGWMARAINVPSVQIEQAVSDWLADAATPIVFVCRSGNRSERVAHYLRDHGHGKAFHLAGGLALAEPSLMLR
jgi:cysteine sulfinate desulfinase/cysteine desulfurase-like protein/rhodanese-related sulfurtransferase